MPTYKKLRGTYDVDTDKEQLVQPSAGARLLNVLTLGHAGARPVGQLNQQLAAQKIADDRRYRQAIGEIQERHKLGLISTKQANDHVLELERLRHLNRVSEDEIGSGLRITENTAASGNRMTEAEQKFGYDTQLGDQGSRNRITEAKSEIDARREAQLQALKDELKVREEQVNAAIDRSVSDPALRERLKGAVLAAPSIQAGRQNISELAQYDRTGEEARKGQTERISRSEAGEAKNISDQGYYQGLGEVSYDVGKTFGNRQVSDAVTAQRENEVRQGYALGQGRKAEEMGEKESQARIAAAQQKAEEAYNAELRAMGAGQFAQDSGAAAEQQKIDEAAAASAKANVIAKGERIKEKFVEDATRRDQEAQAAAQQHAERTRKIQEQADELQKQFQLTGASNQLNIARSPEYYNEQFRNATGQGRLVIPKDATVVGGAKLGTNAPVIQGTSTESKTTYSPLGTRTSETITTLPPLLSTFGDMQPAPLPTKLSGTNALGDNRLIISDPTWGVVPPGGVISQEEAAKGVDEIRRAKKYGNQPNPYQP